MPSDDLVINVRQINGYPFATNAGYGDSVLLQASQGGPYYQMSIQGAVASALAVDPNRGLSVGSTALPLGAGGNVLAGQGFVSPAETGLMFNCFRSNDMFVYLATGVAGALILNDSAGFAFTGFPSGQSLTPVMTAGVAAATISLTGQMALAQQLTVGRDPLGPNEVVTLQYFTLHAIVRNPGNGKLNLTVEDIHNAGGATQVNAALAGYPTAEHPVPEAAGHEIATAGWVREWGKHDVVSSFNGQRGEVQLTTWDIVFAGGAPLVNPQFGGTPRAPTPPDGDSSTIIATTQFVTEAIAAALAGTTPAKIKGFGE